MDRRTRRGIGTAVGLLCVWAIVGVLVPELLPGPVRVARRLPALFEPGPGGGALVHVSVSFARVLLATVLALGVAVALGVAMAMRPALDTAVSTWLPAWMTVPSLVVVLVTMVLFTFSSLSVISAVVVVATPFATVTVREGTEAVDPNLLQMATVHGADRLTIVRDIYVPAVLPAIFGSARFLLSMVWKVVVLAETFGLSTGMGALFRFWFNQGDIVALLAALFLFVFVMIGLQAGLSWAEARLFAWRR